MAHPAPAAPRCPRCGAPAIWHAQLNQWGCDHCRQMLPQLSPQAQPPMPPPQQPQMQPPPMLGPPCPRCNSPATWYAHANQWGCDRCQQPVIPTGGMQQQYRPQNDAGAIILKVVIVIVVLILLVALRVGLSSALR